MQQEQSLNLKADSGQHQQLAHGKPELLYQCQYSKLLYFCFLKVIIEIFSVLAARLVCRGSLSNARPPSPFSIRTFVLGMSVPYLEEKWGG